MAERLSQRLTINVNTSPSDDHDQINLTITSEMIDCSVHTWFDIFNQVLAATGFDEQVIMQGACQLAFNETRPIGLMRKVASVYDLTLNEDATTSSPPHDLKLAHLTPLGDT